MLQGTIVLLKRSSRRQDNLALGGLEGLARIDVIALDNFPDSTIGCRTIFIILRGNSHYLVLILQVVEKLIILLSFTDVLEKLKCLQVWWLRFRVRWLRRYLLAFLSRVLLREHVRFEGRGRRSLYTFDVLTLLVLLLLQTLKETLAHLLRSADLGTIGEILTFSL
jgi:hypothetical protein